MHQPILAPDLSSDRPAKVALDTVYGGAISVPAWWASEEGYRDGQTLLTHQVSDALDARFGAGLADCCIARLTQRTRPMDPHIPPEARRRPPVADACPPSAKANSGRLRAVLLLASAAISAGAVIILIGRIL